MPLPKNLYTSEQVRELDRTAIEEHEIPGSTLMARAGDATFKILTEKWPKAKRIAVICGVGNNAGDGFVVARLVASLQTQVTVFLLGDPEHIKGDALDAYQSLQGTNVTIRDYKKNDDKKFDVIVDAIFGTGLTREVTGVFKDAITSINESNKPILSIDLPSGLNANTGTIWGSAVKATITVSFIGLKQGLFTAEGPEHAGEVHFSDLKVPDSVYKSVPVFCERLDFEKLKKTLPRRERDEHKGQCGHTLVIGGNIGMAGAAQLACEAALRVGSGLVSLVTQPEHASLVTAVQPEIMSMGVKGAVSDLAKKISEATVIAIGPGLGQTKWSKRLFESALNSKLPLVIDADGLNLLAKAPQKRNNWILTPHPGEAARLLNTKTTEINQDRFTAIRAIQKKYSGVVILKGCGSLVCDGGKVVGLCDLGNPGMATGGMGDTLTGVIAALVAQGLTLSDAAKLGTCLHAAAGDLAAKNGERGLIASDLMDNLRKLVN